MKKTLPAAWCLGFLLAYPYAAVGESHIKRVEAVADQERLVDYAVNVDRQCQKGKTPTAQITAPPAHGAVTVRDGEFPHRGPTRFISVSCPERILPGMGVYYKATAGFQGTDRFSLRMTYVTRRGPRTWDGTYIVSVH